MMNDEEEHEDLVYEEIGLRHRLKRLDQDMEGEEFKALSAEARHRAHLQRSAMADYLEILQLRLREDFPEAP